MRRSVVVFLTLVFLSISNYYYIHHSSSGDGRVRRLRSPNPYCSMDILRRALRTDENGSLRYGGTWRNDRHDLIRYNPTDCRYRFGSRWPERLLSGCLRADDIRRIVVFGDSNGMRYVSALNTWIRYEDERNVCEVVKHSKRFVFGVDASYFASKTINISHIIVHDRDCGCCTCYKINCSVVVDSILTANLAISRGTRSKHPDMVNGTRTGYNDVAKTIRTGHEVVADVNNITAWYDVSSEFLVMEYMLDTEVTSFRPHKECDAGGDTATDRRPCVSSTSSQEFIFREYLADDGVPPDLIVIFGSSHDKGRYTLRDYRRNVRRFAELVDEFLPRTTRVVWTTPVAESVMHKPRAWRRYLYEGLTTNEWTQRADGILFDEVSAVFNKSRRKWTFFDLFSMSESVVKYLSVDGIHLRAAWYKHAVSYVLQAICNDFLGP